MSIKDYPLIAITEVFNMPSVDNPMGARDLLPTEEILDSKFRELEGYGWTPDMEVENPIHVFEYYDDAPAYGHRLSENYIGRKIMGNGHHRLVFQALVQGALFVHYTTEIRESAW